MSKKNAFRIKKNVYLYHFHLCTTHTHHTCTLTPTHTHTKTNTQSYLSSIVNCVDTNSMQFNTFNIDFISIRHLGFKKIHLASNSTKKALNCVFVVVYGKFTPI